MSSKRVGRTLRSAQSNVDRAPAVVFGIVLLCGGAGAIVMATEDGLVSLLETALVTLSVRARVRACVQRNDKEHDPHAHGASRVLTLVLLISAAHVESL